MNKKNRLGWGKRLLQKQHIAKSVDYQDNSHAMDNGIRVARKPMFKYPTVATLGNCIEGSFEQHCYGDDGGSDFNCWGEFV